MKICNAFSLNMLATLPASVKVEEVSLTDARNLAINGESCVGHASTAAVFQDVLEVPVAMARATVSLVKGDTVLVGQYVGPRLEEGVTTLPEGATIKWLKVTVE